MSSEMVAVTPEDHVLFCRLFAIGGRNRDSVMAGEQDSRIELQLLAEHRLAERERCALIADDGCDNAGDESEQRMARQIAAAIRESAHVG